MTAGDAPPVVEGSLREQLALAEYVAITLAIVGSGACTEEITFKVTSHSCRAHLALHEHTHAALAGSEVILGNVREVGGFERYAGEGRVNVC